MGEQDFGADDPVGTLTVDQVSDYVEGAPGVGALSRFCPGVGDIPEESTDHFRRPGQNRQSLIEREVHRLN